MIITGKIKFLALALLLCSGTTLFAQSEFDWMLQQAKEYAGSNKCSEAQSIYDEWKGLTRKTSVETEAAIAKCTPARPVAVETSLEISASSVFFDETGENEKSVSVTSSVPWTFSQKAGWIKAALAPGNASVSIACEPNISRMPRKDSLIVKAGDREKIIIVEQSRVIDPLLTGGQLMSRGKTGLAEKYFELVANSEDAEDWNKLAQFYVDRKDYAKAFGLLEKSAGSGNARGMCNLGYMYEMGLEKPKDDISAVKYYQLSAAQNFAPAQYNLGMMYEYGAGVKQNKPEARKWYEKAAQQGFDKAQSKLNELK